MNLENSFAFDQSGSNIFQKQILSDLKEKLTKNGGKIRANLYEFKEKNTVPI